jgi:cellulose synthase/poly-beta-1,6-N-acetylglucosamine synthase-like glycosyltransferase
MYNSLLAITSILFIFYIIQICYYYFHLFQLKNAPKNTKWQKVSVIVSAHNEQRHIHRLLERLKQQTYPKEKLEFIIVDDRSTDHTGQIIDQWHQKDARFKKIRIDEIQNGFGPKKRAIDTAIRQAEGEIILLTDADGRPQPGWVAGMVENFTDNRNMVLGYAPYETTAKSGIFQKLLALEYLSHAAISAASAASGFPLTCVGTNLGYHKKLYLELEGFGPYKAYHSGDDDLFLTHVRESSTAKIKYAAKRETQVYNNAPSTLNQFIHQRIRYASKGFVYPKKVGFGLLLLFILNFLFFISLFASLTHSVFAVSFWALFFIKIFVDTLFMKKIGALLGDTRHIYLMPIAEIFHVPYIVIFAILGNIKSYQWAGFKAK